MAAKTDQRNPERTPESQNLEASFGEELSDAELAGVAGGLAYLDTGYLTGLTKLSLAGAALAPELPRSSFTEAFRALPLPVHVEPTSPAPPPALPPWGPNPWVV